MMQLLKAMKRWIKDLMIKLRFFFAIQKHSSNNPRIFYMMGLGKRFPNLGDQAQAAAIPLWLKKHFECPVIQIKNDEVDQCLPLLVSNIQAGDLIFLHSGGNFGDDWYHTQLDREKIISALHNNSIIQLPQTVFYSDTESGKMALTRSQQVISNHEHLLIFGRDVQSAVLVKSIFPAVTLHARPDMVLSLDNYLNEHHAHLLTTSVKSIKKILLILRNDKEGIYPSEEKQKMLGFLESIGYEVALWDTDVDDVFTESGRLNTLMRYLNYIASFDAVITDRYHGLIFSVLIKRPCVVMKTHNHKLTSAFDWFEQVNFTRRADTQQEIVQALIAISNLTSYHSPDWNALHFDPMADEVKAFLYNQQARVHMKAQ